MSPEDAAKLPIYWIEAALMVPAAENWVENELIKRQAIMNKPN